MISKKEFCRAFIRRFCNSHAYSMEELKELKDHYAMGSTSLGIAMETLGWFDDNSNIKEYLASRGGIYILVHRADRDHPNQDEDKKYEPAILTMREIIALLPDDVPIEESSESTLQL